MTFGKEVLRRRTCCYYVRLGSKGRIKVMDVTYGVGTGLFAYLYEGV